MSVEPLWNATQAPVAYSMYMVNRGERSDSMFGVVVVDLHFTDQLGHQLLHGLGAQPPDLQHSLVVHALRVLVALHHLHGWISEWVSERVIQERTQERW